MFKGKTSTGFEYELSDSVKDDWNFLKLLRKIDSGEAQYIVDVSFKLLGEEQEERLEKHIEEKEGCVKASSMIREVFEILNSNEATKN